ncbi:Nn.00g062340.m01.CDS01 [Neocucurbitaria sp. VM-36]
MGKISAAESDFSINSCIACLFAASILYAALLGIYNLTLHPLRSYPGPLLWRAYRLPYAYALLTDHWPFIVSNLHKRYGHIVRVAPNELSYTDPSARRTILGHHNPTTEGFSEFDKDRSGFMPPANGVSNLLSAHAADHARMRRLLSHSFSEKGLRDMQPRIQSYINSMITGVKEASKTGAEYIDILEWYNWTTFDIIGDLSFGESFHCLERK